MVKREIDERITETKRTVASQTCGILLWGILVLLLYRQFYLKQSFTQYADLFILWLFASAYLSLGTTLMGVRPFDRPFGKAIIVPVIISVTILIVNIYQSTISTFLEGFQVLVVAFVSALVCLSLFKLLYTRWEKKNIKED